MSVSYKIVERKKTQDRPQSGKFYALLKSKGKRDLRFVAEDIAKRSTLNVIDVKAVLEGFLQVIAKILVDGYAVSLNVFSRSSRTVWSTSFTTNEEVNANYIGKLMLKFRANSLLQHKLNNSKFKRQYLHHDEETPREQKT